MKSKVDIYYRLYVGDDPIIFNFATRQAALNFGKQCKRDRDDCRDKPLKIEKVRVLTETVVSYDEA